MNNGNNKPISFAQRSAWKQRHANAGKRGREKIAMHGSHPLLTALKLKKTYTKFANRIEVLRGLDLEVGRGRIPLRHRQLRLR